MKNKLIFLLPLIAIMISSCVNTLEAPPDDQQGSILFFVEPLYEYIGTPVLQVNIEGEETLHKLKLNAPLTGIMRSPGELSFTEWIGKEDVELKDFQPTKMTIEGGEMILSPLKIRLTNKNQIKMMPLTELDENYIRGILSKEKQYCGLNVKFPSREEKPSETTEN